MPDKRGPRARLEHLRLLESKDTYAKGVTEYRVTLVDLANAA
jgi:hypothetical protein